MTIANGYLTLDEAKQTLDATTSAHDQRLEEAVEAASRWIDGYCRRTFFLDAATSDKFYWPSTISAVDIDDIGTTAGLVVKVDMGNDGIYELTIAAANYTLLPLNASVEGLPWAYNRIELATGWVFPAWSSRPSVQITAKWGWPSIPTDVKMACRIQTTRLFKGQSAPFGVIEVQDGLSARMPRVHPEVEALLSPYRRNRVLVA